MELLATFEYKSLKVETFYQGNEKVPNKTYLNGELVYEDNTYRPSPLYNLDAVQTMVALLDFLVMETTATDKEYFIHRGCPQLDEFSETSEADEIQWMVNDYSLKDEKKVLEENEMTVEDCLLIEKYITIA